MGEAVGFLFGLIASVLVLQSQKKVTKKLIFAHPILTLGGLAEYGADFVFAYFQVGPIHYVQYVPILEIERNFQLSENDVVVELFLRLRLLAILFAAMLHD